MCVNGMLRGDQHVCYFSRWCALVSSSLMDNQISPSSESPLTEQLMQHFLDMVYQPGDTPATLAPMM